MKYVTNYFGAFIDLLGQTERLCKYPIMPAEKTQEFIEYLKSTHGAIKTFRNGFEQYIRRANKRISIPLLLFRIRRHKIKLKASGDALFLYSSLHDKNNRISVISLLDLMGVCATNYLLFLSQGRPFRGSIDIGIGIEEKNIGIYGSVVSNAYTLESKIAKWPRIVIGSNIVDYLVQNIRIESNDQKNIKKRLIVMLSRQALSAVIKDTEGIYFLDVLNKQFTDIIRQTGYFDIIDSAYEFVRKSEKEYRGKDNKLHERYVVLKRYFDERLGRKK